MNSPCRPFSDPDPLSCDQIVTCLKRLPALPSAVSEVLASFGDDGVDVDRMAHLISRDLGLTARVLRVANSSFYGLQSRVGTIQEAIVVLGFRAVRSLVLAVGVNGAFRADHCPGFDAPAYLRHGVGTGLAARALAPLVGLNPDLAFTAGLLHDIGILVLATSYPGRYSEVLACRRRLDCFLVDAERNILGMDHGQVGELLADTWHFPSAIREAVAHHHDPSTAAPDSFANLIHVADITVHALGLSGSTEELVMPLDEIAWGRLGFDWESYVRTLPLVEEGFEESCQALAL